MKPHFDDESGWLFAAVISILFGAIIAVSIILGVFMSLVYVLQ